MGNNLTLSRFDTTDAQTVRPYRIRFVLSTTDDVSVYYDGRNGTTTVGTLGSIESEGVRCVKDYNVVILTGTDAQRRLL